MRSLGGASRRKLALKVSILMVTLLFVSAPTFAKGSNNGHHHSKTNYDPDLMQTVSSGCLLSATVSSCKGGYNTTQTFGTALALSHVVTLTITFVPTNASTTTLGFSDSLGNAVTVVSQACAPTAPVICTAVAYFLVAVSGSDDIAFTASHAAGALHFTAEDWYAANSATLAPTGANVECSSSCTDTIEFSPISFAVTPSEAIAVCAYQAYFGGALTSWAGTLPYYSYSNDASSGSGYALLFQATNSTASSYTFSSQTSIAPTSFAGSAEILYI